MLLRLTGWALRLFLVNFTNRILIQADVLASGHMPSDFDSPQTLFETIARRELVEALQANTSRRFFLGLVELLVAALGCTRAYVAELRQEGRTFRTCAGSARGNTIDDFEIPIYGTHCETALRGEVAVCPDGLPQLFRRTR